MGIPLSGRVVWLDLTVDDTERVRDFYAAVVGWRPEPVDMGGYDDYGMVPPGTDDTDGAVAGVCARRGVNERVPPQWVPYVVVDDVERSVATAIELGGAVVDDRMTSGGWVLLRDPAGALVAVMPKPQPIRPEV